LSNTWSIECLPSCYNQNIPKAFSTKQMTMRSENFQV
jgi:hypothetical protein